jgi:hypothetical protein
MERRIAEARTTTAVRMIGIAMYLALSMIPVGFRQID